MDAVQLAGAVCGAGICLGFLAIVAFVVLGALKSSSGQKPRADTATALNMEKQYPEFLAALDALAKKYKLKQVSRHETFTGLAAACTGKKECVLLEGKARGRSVSVSARMAGDALITEIGVSGNFALPIDATTKSVLHVQGLGMDLRYMGGKPVVDEKLTIRPEFERDAERTKAALTPALLANMEKLIFLKPRTMNLSSQVVEFYEKKFTFYKDRAIIRDYGLVRDSNYAAGLIKLFLNVASDWEKKK